MKVVNFVVLVIMIGLVVGIIWIQLPPWFALWFNFLIWGQGAIGLSLIAVALVTAASRRRRGKLAGTAPQVVGWTGAIFLASQILLWAQSNGSWP